MIRPPTRSLAVHARQSFLAFVAVLALGFAPVAQAQKPGEQQLIGERINLLMLDYELSEMKAQLWNATAAVAFHFADGDFEALADYKIAVARFQKHLTLAAGRIPKSLGEKLTDLERKWKAHRSIASRLLAAGAKKGNGDDHRVIIGELWSKAKTVDATINGLHDIVVGN